jgi:hypothetical protein
VSGTSLACRIKSFSPRKLLSVSQNSQCWRIGFYTFFFDQALTQVRTEWTRVASSSEGCHAVILSACSGAVSRQDRPAASCITALLCQTVLQCWKLLYSRELPAAS